MPRTEAYQRREVGVSRLTDAGGVQNASGIAMGLTWLAAQHERGGRPRFRRHDIYFGLVVWLAHGHEIFLHPQDCQYGHTHSLSGHAYGHMGLPGSPVPTSLDPADCPGTLG